VFARVSNYIGWINAKIEGKIISALQFLVATCNWLLDKSYEVPFWGNILAKKIGRKI